MHTPDMNEARRHQWKRRTSWFGGPAPNPTRGSDKERWVPLFKAQVFFSCVSFSIIVPSIANYLARMGAPPFVLGVAVASYSLGEMVGSAVFGRQMTRVMRTDPDVGPRSILLRTICFGVVGSTLYVVADVLGQGTDAQRAAAPWVVVLGRFLGGIWTGGKMVVEQTYVGVAALEERVTPLTSDIGVYAVLGFVAGPSFGAIFAPVNFSVGGYVRVDEFTAPGYFMVALTLIMYGTCRTFFDPSAGYARPLRRLDESSAEELRESIESPASAGLRSPAPARSAGGKSREALATPSRAGLVTCLVAFFAHFYSFAIQETITTPFATARYGWDQRRVDELFAAVSVLSLVTSVAVAKMANFCSDFDLLVLSLVLGLAGSLLLLDRPLVPYDLGEARFLAGFALITVAFPFGRNVALAIFSKVLGPAEQGEWMGLMFVVGALPRCLGPSWALYALDLACSVFPDPKPCPLGGRTCLEFIISAAVFAATLGAVLRHRGSLKPYDEARGGLSNGGSRETDRLRINS